ncbi:hypothetical protein QNI19_32060 [Cytophagaceae bacterium DM2B3-1]|uniref:Uncharacterized protein n=1 Tax=Xanthocytophaga flava TaxID=3048013 RepID=A0ABT7CV62_9BACT|nr:hypothetical protein [Xanthocytophaga flavus]MDJ1497618.1 hypothetical protein [Xanthocytophaga flavus]
MITNLSDQIEQITDQSQINQFIESSDHIRYLLSLNKEERSENSLIIPQVERKPESAIDQLDLKILIKKAEIANNNNIQLWLFRVEDFLRRGINIEDLLYKICGTEIRDIEEHIIQQILFLIEPENICFPIVPQNLINKVFYKKIIN